MTRPFITWPFPAKDSTATRTLATRLSEVVNVKDWGAVGDNSTNDATSIQNAINYAIGPRADGTTGGKVSFPSGFYVIGTALAVGHSSTSTGVQLIGSGAAATTITNHGGITTGIMISAGGLTNDCLEKIEDITISAGGVSAVKATRTGFIMRKCFIGSAGIAVDTSAAINTGVYDCWATTSITLNADSTAPFATGSIGFLQGQGVHADCRATRYDIAFAIAADGATNLGCIAETDTTGMRVGWNGSEVAVSAPCVIGFQTERSNTALDLYNCTGGYFAGNTLTGTQGTPIEAGINTAVYSAGTVTVTTSTTHHIPAGTRIIQLVGPSNTTFIPGGTAVNPGGWVVATVGGTGNQFTYPISPAPTGGWGTGTWDYPLQYGIRCRKVFESMIVGTDVNIQASIGSVDLDYGGAADAANNTMMSLNSSYGFVMPTNLKVRAGWKFINAGSTTLLGNLTNPATPTALVFANLPGTNNAGTIVTQPGPLEGQEYDISDCNTAASGNFAATGLAGGGANHVKVRWNGSAWAISG